MFDYETTLAGIEKKVRKLIEDNERLRSEVEELKVGQKALEQKNQDNNNIINQLKEENTVLKLRNSLTEKGDSTEIKLKINQLIRTIDKSLALLNKIE